MLVIIFLLGDIIFLNIYKYSSKYNINDNKIIGIITDIRIDEDTATIYIKGKEKVLVKYYYKDINKINNLELGDKISVTGTLEIPNNNTIPNLFNYKKYLYNNGIYYIMNTTNITKIKNNISILYYFKNKIIKRINNIDKTNSYLKTFILGDKSGIDSDIIKSYQNNGISHLFSISGMHVSLFAGILLSLLKKFSYDNKYNYSIVIIFLMFYMFLVNYTASILRTFTMYLVSSINKVFNLKIKSIDIALISLVILIIINPRIIYNMGFQYSYIVSFTLILLSKKINIKKNYFIKLLYISYISFLVSIPICIYNFYQINLISIILNIFMVPLVSIIIFPLSLITFIISYLDNILYIFIKIIEIISLYSSKINILTINLCKINIYIIILYYIVIYLSLYNYKYLGVLLTILGIHKYIIYINPSFNITTLDVGQGDSIFIKLPYNKGNILIDTGGVTYNNDYSIVLSKTVPYLKSIGVYKINYLIISHGDYDHMGEAINLVNIFKVEKVIFNCGPYNDLEQELIKLLDKKKIKYYSCIKELNIDNNKLYFLQTKEYDNENDNSNVIYTELDGYKFMFMGDASIITEKEIMNKYDLPNIDILKVGHHGSKTSSSIEFIDDMNPKYSVISVGKKNRYGHPNKEVLDNLNQSKIYRTDIDGSIMFKIKNNKLKIETCTP